jgi:hypothetical protein
MNQGFQASFATTVQTVVGIQVDKGFGGRRSRWRGKEKSGSLRRSEAPPPPRRIETVSLS